MSATVAYKLAEPKMSLVVPADVDQGLRDFFDGSDTKFWLWWFEPNPQFGGIRPVDLVQMGRGEKVFAFVREQLKYNETALH
jgi:hypothetical protein